MHCKTLLLFVSVCDCQQMLHSHVLKIHCERLGWQTRPRDAALRLNAFAACCAAPTTMVHSISSTIQYQENFDRAFGAKPRSLPLAILQVVKQ